MPHFTRRVIETILITIVSSLPIYLIAKSGLVPSTRVAYIILFGISAVIFLCLSNAALRTYLVAVDDVKTYLLTNGILLIAQGLICIAGLLWFSNDLYTAVFGFTKPLRGLGLGDVWAAAVFWFVHFVQIILIPVIRARVKKEFDEMAITEALESEDDML